MNFFKWIIGRYGVSLELLFAWVLVLVLIVVIGIPTVATIIRWIS